MRAAKIFIILKTRFEMRYDKKKAIDRKRQIGMIAIMLVIPPTNIKASFLLQLSKDIL